MKRLYKKAKENEYSWEEQEEIVNDLRKAGIEDKLKNITINRFKNFYNENILLRNLERIINNKQIVTDCTNVNNIYNSIIDYCDGELSHTEAIEKFIGDSYEDFAMDLFHSFIKKVNNMSQFKYIDENISQEHNEILSDFFWFDIIVFPTFEIIKSEIKRLLPTIVKENKQNDNWNYENNVDNKFEERPNKRINRILKRMYKDARKMK